jgi:hypothetical protein
MSARMLTHGGSVSALWQRPAGGRLVADEASAAPQYNRGMALIDKHAPGTFCWVDLATSDQNAAKHFYCSLFGWTFVDQPIGPDYVYTMFQLDGRNSAAAYSEKTMPPRWNLYVSVANADVRAQLARELGGAVPRGVFDAGTAGRMAIIVDPAGAAFCIWQANDANGLGVMGENNSYCWADLVTDDRMGAKQFYEGLFDWRIFPGTGKDESSYLHIMAGEKGIAGIQPDEMRKQGVPAHWLPYFMTADADQATVKAKELGATILVPAMNVDKTLRIAIIADPQGAVFALFQP